MFMVMCGGGRNSRSVVLWGAQENVSDFALILYKQPNIPETVLLSNILVYWNRRRKSLLFVCLFKYLYVEGIEKRVF